MSHVLCGQKVPLFDPRWLGASCKSLRPLTVSAEHCAHLIEALHIPPEISAIMRHAIRLQVALTMTVSVAHCRGHGSGWQQLPQMYVCSGYCPSPMPLGSLTS
jgi:hypothetical protein